MHEVLVNRLGGLSLPRKSVVRLTDRPDMTLVVYRGRKTTMQQQQQPITRVYKQGAIYGIALRSGICLFFCLLSRNFDLVSRNFDLVIRNFELVSRNFDLLT